MSAAAPIHEADSRQPGAATRLDHEAVIIGSGFSGLGAAHALQKMGLHDFLILEREREPGGTWVQHDYPGLEVDMPFFIYSFPFDMKPDWSHVYPSAQEMKDYTQGVIRKFDLAPRIRCNAPVEQAVYDEDANVWRVRIEGGDEVVTRYLVNATGLLVIPKLPEIEGIEDFRGKLIHSARWDWSFDPSDKRVAVIGTGATAIQIAPAIADQVKSLDVYQRTPIWLLPKPNPELSEKLQRALRIAPFLQVLMRWAMNLFVEITMGMGFVRYSQFPGIFAWVEKKATQQIRNAVDDPETQEKLIPDYSFFCKRPSFSNIFYPIFNRENVALITEPIERISGKSVITRDGEEREIDALICATGYDVFNRKCMPGYALIGRDGVDLGEFWEKNRFQAYEGATVPGFPNLFFFMGPYSAAGASYFTMIDTQSKHMTRCLEEARRRGANYVEVRRDAHDRDFAKVLRRRSTMVLFGGRCGTSNSYYFDAQGDAPGMRPVTGFEHWLRSRFFDLRSYVFERRGNAQRSGSGRRCCIDRDGAPNRPSPRISLAADCEGF